MDTYHGAQIGYVRRQKGDDIPQQERVDIFLDNWVNHNDTGEANNDIESTETLFRRSCSESVVSKKSYFRQKKTLTLLQAGSEQTST
jgi:hypothetical protein